MAMYAQRAEMVEAKVRKIKKAIAYNDYGSKAKLMAINCAENGEFLAQTIKEQVEVFEGD